MADEPDRFAPERLLTERLALDPLRVEDAGELAPLLDDAGLHTYIGGAPATVAELRERYRRQVAGRSPDGTERWLNWVVRRRDPVAAVGTVQATIAVREGTPVASVAWVVATPHQGRGYAREAAAAMVRWLGERGAGVVVAHVHPEHRASMAVARAVGLRPTAEMVDGEVRWETGD